MSTTTPQREASSPCHSPSNSYPTTSPPPHALLHHLSPSSLPPIPLSLPRASLRSPSFLKSLPFNSKIPTLSPNRSLTITSSTPHRCVSLNGVKINADSPIHDDGTSLIVFGIGDFLDPGYGVSRPSANQKCHDMSFNDTTMVFEEAGGVLRSKGYSVMASFLELQVIGFKKSWISSTGLTLFAPVDQAMTINSGNFSNYASLFFSHLVPCKILWSDLIPFDDGVQLKTLLNGFKLNVTRSGKVLMLNGVEFASLDLYYSDWLAVHGLRRVLPVPPERPKQVAAHDNGEF
ncbi:hypothetical protein EZV62_018565 [Acer yangbiense]|uniref:FAS1 domain-containing protein n=1 Tax=Acer yangbiense TaxID=1000413 RepID=A0A5C7HLN6_9ROSI|nr:hypothetical protein EZV62_018565 [Acer yangbiense]